MAGKATGVTALVKFITVRERHRVAKEAGRKVDRPDPIISTFRFCNVRRNDDRVTKWVHENYLDRWRDAPDLWFALLVARLFNNEETLEAIEKGILPFKPEYLRTTLHHRSNKMGLKNFNAAYIVSTNGRAMDKVDYVIDYVLAPAWKERGYVSGSLARATALDAAHQILKGLNGLASFMAAQVVADLKYAAPDKWEDFYSFAASGPGSRRGLNRVLGLDKDAPMPELVFRQRLAVLWGKVNARLKWAQDLTAQDLQNCLCEFDKYERARTGDGRPKQLYTPKGE